MRRSRWIVVLASLVVAAGCDDARNPAGPSASAPPVGKISDGRFAGGNDDFFFLPPVMPDPSGSPNYDAGAFNGALGPTVQVCQLAANPITVPTTDCALGSDGKPILVANFTSNQVSVGTDQYQVNWHTDESNLVIDRFYRLQVFLGSVRLGFADIDPVSSGKDLKNANTGQVIPLLDGRTLPVKFRIERGALCTNKLDCGEFRVLGAVGGTFVTNTRDAGIRFEPGFLPAGVTEITLKIERVTVGLDNRCHGTVGNARLWREFEACFEMTSDPDLRPYGGIQRPAIAGQCVELPSTDPLYDYLQPYKSHNGGELIRLPSAAAPFLDCEGFSGSPSPIGQAGNPLLHYASAGLRQLGVGLNRIFGVQPAYAIDLGLGEELGVGSALSRFGWAIGLEAETTGDDQSVGFGLPASPLEVHIKSLHSHAHSTDPDEHPEDIADIPVTFTVTEGDGYFSLGTNQVPIRTQQVLTGSDGRATVPFVTSLTGATNVVTATSPTFDADEAVSSFTITGLPSDLVIENIVRTIAQPTTNDPLSGSFNVRNIGAGVALPTVARVVLTLEEEGSEVISTVDYPVPRLNPGQVVTITTGVLFPPHDAGDHRVTITANPTATVVEANGQNNSATQDFTVQGPSAALSGFVVDNGSPQLLLAGTQVQILSTGLAVITDNAGHYAFPTLAPGNYTVRFSQPGYQTQDRNITIATGQPVALNVLMPLGVFPPLLSMQTGASYQLPTPLSRSASWSGGNSNATVSNGVVTAIVGGESASVDARSVATLTAADNGATGQVLINSFDFNIFPRDLALVWAPVNTAVSYHVEWEFGNGPATNGRECGAIPANCTTWSPQGSVDVTNALAHTIAFVGAQPGRWRITATLDCGTVLEPSPWVYFAFDR